MILSFVIAEEDLRIKTSYPFNEVTAVFLRNNSRYHEMHLCDVLTTGRCVNAHYTRTCSVGLLLSALSAYLLLQHPGDTPR